MDKISANIMPQLSKVDTKKWDSLNGGEIFLSHSFLSALEDSGSVSAQTGWQPCHLVLEQGNKFLSALPLYLKAHSQGEFVFDHGWAEALEHAGSPYYPKLVCCVPFTPVSGLRFLGEDKYHDLLLDTAFKTMSQLKASSLHINFPYEEQWEKITKKTDMMKRTGYQFHWFNKGYTDFNDFLSGLNSRRRKTIRKERARAIEGLEIKQLTGSDLTENIWDYFFEFYTDTSSRKWGSAYLNRKTFSLLSERLADRILLIMAFRGKTPIAGALNFIDNTKLYGRYWGSLEYHDCLHFELSYYQAIDYAIANKLKVVEAGAQGHHKIDRGYEPIKTYSAHKIVHLGLSAAVADYLCKEKKAVETEIAALNQTTPFLKN